MVYTKLNQELNGREEEQQWFKPRGEEVLAQDFFLPKKLDGDSGQQWERSRLGENTVCYNKHSITFDEYHITIAKETIPEQLSLHETTHKTKGLSGKDSTFIVQNGTLIWDKKSVKPSYDINNLVGSIVAYQNQRYKNLILNQRKNITLPATSQKPPETTTPTADIPRQKGRGFKDKPSSDEPLLERFNKPFSSQTTTFQESSKITTPTADTSKRKGRGTFIETDKLLPEERDYKRPRRKQ